MIIRGLAIALGVVAAMLLIREVIRAWREVPPQCRRCGQPLSAAQIERGVSADERCPECGHQFAGGGVVTRIVRPRRVAVLAAVPALAIALPTLWPGPATRIAAMPTWWVLQVERPMAAPAFDPLIIREMVVRGAEGRLSDAAFDDLMAEAIASLQLDGQWPGSPDAASAWEWLTLLAVARDRLETDQIAAIHAALVDVIVAAEPRPPDGLQLTLRVAPSGTPARNVPRGQLPIDVSAILDRVPEVVATTEGLWIDGRRSASALDAMELNGDAWIGSPKASMGWSWGEDRSAATGFQPTAVSLGAGPHAVAVRIDFRLGDHAWTREAQATILQPAWPPDKWSGTEPAPGAVFAPPVVGRFGDRLTVRVTTNPDVASVQPGVMDAELTRDSGDGFGGAGPIMSVRASRQIQPDDLNPRASMEWAFDLPAGTPAGPATVRTDLRWITVVSARDALAPPATPGEPGTIRGWIRMPDGMFDIPITIPAADASDTADAPTP